MNKIQPYEYICQLITPELSAIAQQRLEHFVDQRFERYRNRAEELPEDDFLLYDLKTGDQELAGCDSETVSALVEKYGREIVGRAKNQRLDYLINTLHKIEQEYKGTLQFVALPTLDSATAMDLTNSYKNEHPNHLPGYLLDHPNFLFNQVAKARAQNGKFPHLISERAVYAWLDWFNLHVSRQYQGHQGNIFRHINGLTPNRFHALALPTLDIYGSLLEEYEKYFEERLEVKV